MSFPSHSRPWDPTQVLKILNPEYDNRFTCRGWAPSQGRRCRNPINAGNRSIAHRILSDLSSHEPPRIDDIRPVLRSLADICLCVRYHRNQANQIVQEWAKDIGNYEVNTRSRDPPLRQSVPQTHQRSTQQRPLWRTRDDSSISASTPTSLGIGSAPPSTGDAPSNSRSPSVRPRSSVPQTAAISTNNQTQASQPDFEARIASIEALLSTLVAAQQIAPAAAPASESAAPRAAIHPAATQQRSPSRVSIGTGITVHNPAASEPPTTSTAGQQTNQRTFSFTASPASAQRNILQPSTRRRQQPARSLTPTNGTSTSASSVIDISSGVSTPTTSTPHATTPSSPQAQPQSHFATSTQPRNPSPSSICRLEHVARRSQDQDCAICATILTNEPLSELVWCKAQCGNNIHKACFEEWERWSSNRQLRCVICRTNWQPPCSHDTQAPPYEMWAAQEDLGVADIFETYEDLGWDALCEMARQPDDWRTWRVLAAMRNLIGSGG